MLSNLFFSEKKDQAAFDEKVNSLVQQDRVNELHQMLRLEARKNNSKAFKDIIAKSNQAFREKLTCYPPISEEFNRQTADLKEAVDEKQNGRISQLLIWHPELWCYPLYNSTYTVFHYVAEFCDLPMLNQLIFFLNSNNENKQKVLDLPAPIGWYPRYLNQKLLLEVKKYISLDSAQKSKKLLDMSDLLNWRPDIDAVDEESGLQPIQYAAMIGDLDLLRLLAGKGANLQAVTPGKDNLLHLAILHAPVDTNWQALINWLVEKGVVTDSKNEAGYAPIEIARTLNRRAAVRCLESALVELNSAQLQTSTKLSEKVSLIVTYESIETKQVSILLVRDNPLTRGWQSDFTRPIKKLMQAKLPVPGYQFPGGGIQREGRSVANWVNQYFIKPEDQQLAQASLRKLSVETGLELSDENLRLLNLSESLQFSIIKTVKEYDDEKKESVQRYFCHLSLGQLTTTQIDKLLQMMKMGHEIIAVSWIKLDTVYYTKDHYQQSAFSLIPEKSGNTTQCRSNEKGVEVIKRQFGNRIEEIPRIGCLDLSVLFNPLHAELLETLQFDLRKKAYELSPILRLEDFQIEEEFVDNRYTRYFAQPVSFSSLDNRYTRFIARHIPTNTVYRLKFPTLDGLIDKNATIVASELHLTKTQVLERFCQNELLAAKLYESYDIKVLPIKLIESETGEWGIGYIDIPDLQIKKFSIAELQENFLQGLACDIAFANFNAIEGFGQSHLGYLSTASETIIRMDYSGALQFRGRGLLKDKSDWSTEVSMRHILKHERHGEFKDLCSQLDSQDWKRVKFILSKVKAEKIQDIVKEYGYGTEEERQQLANLILVRIENTYQAIKQHIKAQKQKSLSFAKSSKDNSSTFLQKMSSLTLGLSSSSSFLAGQSEEEKKKSIGGPKPI